MLTLYGMVLAGGLSRRMGLDKATQKLGDKTLLKIMTEHLLNAGCCEVKVSSNRLANGIPDEYVNFGPVAGIHATVKSYLNENKNGYLLVVPVDMPMLSPDLLQQLTTLDSAVNLCHYADYQLPICLALQSDTLKKLTQLLAGTTEDHGISLKKMFREFNEHIISVASERVQEFVNCNSKADIAALQLSNN